MDSFRAKWSDGAFRPIGNYAPATLHDLLSEGEIVTLDLDRDRSMTSHRHQFAWVREAWQNLPEHLMDRPWAETAETLRKHALIATGFCNVTTIECGSQAAAQRVMRALRAAEAKAEGYALGRVQGTVATIWTPHSQSKRAMGAKVFQESKTKVLDWIAAQIGVTPEELRGAA